MSFITPALDVLSILALYTVGTLQIIASANLDANTHQKDKNDLLYSGLTAIGSALILTVIMIAFRKTLSPAVIFAILVYSGIILLGTGVVGGFSADNLKCDAESSASLKTAYRTADLSSKIGTIAGAVIAIIQLFVQREKIAESLGKRLPCEPVPCKAGKPLPCTPTPCQPVPCVPPKPSALRKQTLRALQLQ